jgi:hypothetical protein
MPESDKTDELHLPTPRQIHQAVDLYLQHAYPAGVPDSIKPLLPPPGDFDVGDWLLGDATEREPADAPLEEVRIISLRLGNMIYPHMKLRISRPPNEPYFIFSVDSHDAILQAPPGSADHKMLEELKAENSKIASAIMADWDQADLPTERNYMRFKIEQARHRQSDEDTSQ